MYTNELSNKACNIDACALAIHHASLADNFRGARATCAPVVPPPMIKPYSAHACCIVLLYTASNVSFMDSNTAEICSLVSKKISCTTVCFYTAFQNYLRTQAGNTTTVNIITCTVDYLLRLQESISDFYWHYSSQETIDLLARDSLLKAFRVAKQVFRTLTEYIQVTYTSSNYLHMYIHIYM